MSTRYVLTEYIADDEFFYLVMDTEGNVVYDGTDRNAAKAAMMGE